jgi:hypothetical protein
MKNKIKITFDKESASFILDCFKDRFKNKCIFCDKEITKDNLGAVIQGGYICDNFLCTIDLASKLIKIK